MTDDQGIVVVGTDGSAGAEHAVGWALEEARAHGDAVLLVHAWQYPAVAVTTYAGEPLPVFGHDDLERLAAEALTKAENAARKREPGVRVDTRLVEAHPVEALLDASRGARLLVVGSRGLGGFKELLLGSVSTACARHARCPVVIVPPAES